MKTDQNKQETIKNNGYLEVIDAVYYCKDCMKWVKIKDGLCKHMGNNKLKEDFSMSPHKECIKRLQSLINCACIGDCLTEDKKDERIAKLENIVNWHENLRIEHEKSYAQLVELYDGLIQNHKNGIKTDNRLENLEIVLKKLHKGEATCPYCQKVFYVR